MNSFHFFKQVWHASAPLAVWGVHFLLCYVLVAVQCTLTQRQDAWPLWVATAAALGVCAWMLWRGRGALRGDAQLMAQARAVMALLAIPAIGWNVLPLALLGGCG